MGACHANHIIQELDDSKNKSIDNLNQEIKLQEKFFQSLKYKQMNELKIDYSNYGLFDEKEKDLEEKKCEVDIKLT